MIPLTLILICSSPEPIELPAQSWTRGQGFAVPLQSDSSAGYWGESTRKSDHATVAMNSVSDVLVAFHSSRPTFNINYPNLKQVEVALFEYSAGSDSWSLNPLHQAVVGGIDPTPLNSVYFQLDVKCERPDVIAVGEWFFVVWTRI